MELTHAGIDVDQSSLRPPTYTAYVLWHHVRSGQTLNQRNCFIFKQYADGSKQADVPVLIDTRDGSLVASQHTVTGKLHFRESQLCFNV